MTTAELAYHAREFEESPEGINQRIDGLFLIIQTQQARVMDLERRVESLERELRDREVAH